VIIPMVIVLWKPLHEDMHEHTRKERGMRRRSQEMLAR
jgi:hypothetical protein